MHGEEQFPRVEAAQQQFTTSTKLHRMFKIF